MRPVTITAVGWLVLLSWSSQGSSSQGAEQKTKTYEYTAWMESQEAELTALGYKVGKDRVSIPVSGTLVVQKVSVSLIKVRFKHGADILKAVGYPSPGKSDLPKIANALAQDWLEPLLIGANPDALKQKPRLELIRADAQLHQALSKEFGIKIKDGVPEKLLPLVPGGRLSMGALVLADSSTVGLRTPISIVHLIQRFEPGVAGTEEDADSVAEEIVWSKEAKIGDGTYKSLASSRRVIQAAILENLGFEVGHPAHKDQAKRKAALEKLESAKRTALKTWRTAAEKDK